MIETKRVYSSPRVMAIIDPLKKGSLTQVKLSQTTGIDIASVSAISKKLEKIGVVTRTKVSINSYHAKEVGLSKTWLANLFIEYITKEIISLNNMRGQLAPMEQLINGYLLKRHSMFNAKLYTKKGFSYGLFFEEVIKEIYGFSEMRWIKRSHLKPFFVRVKAMYADHLRFQALPVSTPFIQFLAKKYHFKGAKKELHELYGDKLY